MTRKMTAVICACAAVALLLLPAFAQQEGTPPPARPGLVERTEIRVLLVDLIVTDRKGNPVTDLSRDEIHLYIDNREVAIDSFDALSGIRFTAPPAAAGETPPATPSGRGLHRAILFFDSLNSRALDQQRVREQTLAYLERNLLPFDQVMILSHGDRLRVELPFTADPDEWGRTLGRLVEEQSQLESYVDGEDRRVNRIYDTCLAVNNSRLLARNMMPETNPFEVTDSDMDGPAGGRGGGVDGLQVNTGEERRPGGFVAYEAVGLEAINDPAIDSACGAGWAEAEQYSREEWSRARATLTALEQLVLALRGVPGRKSLLLVSEGIRARPGEQYHVAAGCSPCGRSATGRNPITFDLNLRIRDLFRDANASNLTVHTLDSRVGRDLDVRPVRYRPGDPTGRAEARSEFLSSFAHQTGGLRGAPSSAFGDNLARIAALSGVRYQIGYDLPGARPDGQRHKIRIEIDRKKLDFHYRQSFHDLGREDRDRAAMIGAVALPETFDGLPTAARLQYLRRGKHRFDLFLEMGVPFDELLWIPGPDGDWARIEFAGAIEDDSGEVRHQFWDEVELKRERGQEEGTDRGVFYRGRVELPPGDYELRAVIRDAAGGRLGGTRVGVHIPSFRPGPLSMSDPALGRLSRGDMVVGSESPAASGFGARRRIRRESVVPLLDDGLSERETLVTYFQIMPPEAAGPDWHPDLSVHFRFVRDGEEIGRHRPISISEFDPAMGFVPVAQLTPLGRFEPGRYELRVEVVDETSAETVQRIVTFRVR